ncbi:MAG TPA: hypothetical protein VI636_12230 [Candidatus Angelobacter sp.]
MGTPIAPPPKEKKPFDRTVAIVSLIIGLAAVIVAFWQGAIANGARMDAQESAQREQLAENEAKAAKQRVEQERTKFCRFTENYRTMIGDLSVSLSRYSENPSEDNKRSVVASAAALASNVENWRKVQESIAIVLDGEVDKLREATSSADIEAIRLQAETISKKANSQFELIDAMLEKPVTAAMNSEGSQSPPSPQPTELVVSEGVSCDCDNTQAPNIGGAATRQCLASEQALKKAAAAGQLKLQIENGKIISSSANLCDSVTQGSAAWPAIGAPSSRPR